MVKITATEQNIGKKKRMERNKDSLRDPWDNIKHTNISHYRGPRRRREKVKGSEKILEEIIAENFSNIRKKIVSQVQEAQKVPGKINPRRNTSRQIVIKLTEIKDRDKILEATKEK